MRTAMKGGVWKNLEDEILKAAVMKYGLNNWSRVASLLVRKSAKQCKSRWYEWLDPSVKKIEWSRDEEEKLLHLAKLFPNQWRTIAPVVGRTAHQCLEHYDRLLDEAQGRTDEDRLNDPRNLRPGEIDPHPETKPSRADAVDMEEDEKEMLAEARARLANTRGKKAKRKARETQLKERRHIASLQKRRESKAAGLFVANAKESKESINYATEVMLEKKPPPGFYNVGSEETPVILKGTSNLNLQELEGKRKADEERVLRKADLRKLKRLAEDNLPAVMQAIEKKNDIPMASKRIKLDLPEPQVSDTELTEIMQIGYSESKLQSFSKIHSEQLLNDDLNQKNIIGMTPIRTPMVENSVFLEAQNAVARLNATNPLEGGEQPKLHELNFGKGATVDHAIPRTPNPLAFSNSKHLLMNTPLLLNSNLVSSSSQIPQTPQQGSFSAMEIVEPDSNNMEKYLSEKIRESLLNLPEPQNEIEISLPATNPIELQNDEDINMEEDAGDIDKKKKIQEQLNKELEFKRRSQVVQQELPRPLFPESIILESHIVEDGLTTTDLLHQADQLINTEMYAMVVNDALKFPLPFKGLRIPSNVPAFPTYKDQELENAKKILQQEIHLISQENNFSIDEMDNQLKDEFLSQWDDLLINEFLYDSEQKRYVSKHDLTQEKHIQCLKESFENMKNRLSRDAKKNTKITNKIVTLTKGYEDKIKTLSSSFESVWSDTMMSELDFNAFLYLEKRENQSIAKRKLELEKRVQQQKNRHTNLQYIYADVKARLDTLQKQLEVMG